MPSRPGIGVPLRFYYQKTKDQCSEFKIGLDTRVALPGDDEIVEILTHGNVQCVG